MEETQEYISRVKKKFNIQHIRKILKRFKDLNILVIGDTIIDQYVFVWPKGRAIKDPILSTEYKFHETYPGGILAIANHLSDFINKVKLVTLIGDKNHRLNFIKKAVKDNITIKTFIKKDSYTTVKKRYVDFYRNNKLFKVEYMNDKPITENLSKKIIKYLHKEIPKYDLVIVGDFGHGFINEEIRDKLEEKSNFLAVNAQSNSSNMGYNYPTLYKKPDFISMSEEELRMPLSRRFEPIEELIKEAHNTFNLNNFLVTLGKNGCIYVNKSKIFKAPILTTSIKDTVGAGDALFALTSLCVYSKLDNELIPFIANCAGGLGANIMGNKESITKEMLLNFIRDVLK